MTAAWCITCLVNERIALSTDAVREPCRGEERRLSQGRLDQPQSGNHRACWSVSAAPAFLSMCFIRAGARAGGAAADPDPVACARKTRTALTSSQPQIGHDRHEHDEYSEPRLSPPRHCCLAVPSVQAEPKVGAPAPAFTAVDINGKPVNLGDYKGKTVVLEWTNDGCPYVRKHYGSGNMQALQKKWTDQGIVWLSVISSPPGEQGFADAARANALTADRKAGAERGACSIRSSRSASLWREDDAAHVHRHAGRHARLCGRDRRQADRAQRAISRARPIM